MGDYTIDGFWKKILSGERSHKISGMRGWYSDLEDEAGFVEAPLFASYEFGDEVVDLRNKVILVSAPGAVGKTTLAREISRRTGAIYIDLAEADPVGGNSITGGLYKSGVLLDWQSGKTSLLIDGLDEARLKVTQEGFEAFLEDIASLAPSSAQPIVLFGRTGAIQDAWLTLTEKIKVTVLEIGYYNSDLALKFITTRVELQTPYSQHSTIQKKALGKILGKLRADTTDDGDRFAGYAPVLKVISDFVADDPNPAAIIARIDRGEQSITLNDILDSVLLREKNKLNSLPLDDRSLLETLYTPQEQIGHLLALIYNAPPPSPPAMSPKDAERYSNALTTWVAEHPFLDGNKRPASAVFEAAIVSAALKLTTTAAQAVSRELAKGAAANPFIPEFYFDNIEDKRLPPEHVGLIYASLRARLAQGDQANLSFEGFEGEEDSDEQLNADVEITIIRSGEDTQRVRSFVSNQVGVLRLGSHLEDIEVSAPLSSVEVGGARELFLVPPISIQCQKIQIAAERVIVDSSVRREENTALLEAEVAEVGTVVSAPIINGDAKLFVIWDGSEKYPWNAVRGNPTLRSDPKEKEALRRFRKFVIAFRSHSKGSLKRLAAKLDHERMTKGVGQGVLDKMKEAGIITRDGSMYTLHPDMLAEKAGAAYSTTMAQEYSRETIDFVLGRTQGD